MEDSLTRCGRPQTKPTLHKSYLQEPMFLLKKKKNTQTSQLKGDRFSKSVRKHQETVFFPFPQAICSQHESYLKSNQTSLNL